MERLHSQLIGLPLRVPEENVTLGRVDDLVIDPDRGDLVALITSRGQVVAPLDVLPFEGNEWTIRECDALLDPDELIRLNIISPTRRVLLKKPVFTRHGDFVGKVADYTLKMEILSLSSLTVTRNFLGMLMDQHIFGWKEILEITDNAVIVKDLPSEVEAMVSVKKKVEAPMPT